MAGDTCPNLAAPLFGVNPFESVWGDPAHGCRCGDHADAMTDCPAWETSSVMADESALPDLEELAALVRTAVPDGTDAVQLVRDDAAWAAYSEGFAALLAPDFVYEDSAMPDHAGETYRGTEGYRRAATSLTEPFEKMIFDLERIVGAAGNRVVSIHRVRATARKTGISFDLQAAYIWNFREGEIFRLQGFIDPDKALKAAGLEK